MGFWDSVAAFPLQKTATNIDQTVDNRRVISRARFDDERIVAENIIAIADELVATELVMMVTSDLPFRGAICTGTEQLWESEAQGIRIFKREFADNNQSYVRIETEIDVNSRRLHVAAEFYSDGGSIIAQYPDGFSRTSVKFAISDEETKRVIIRRLLSRLSQLSVRLAMA